jgi:hypothetical protein
VSDLCPECDGRLTGTRTYGICPSCGWKSWTVTRATPASDIPASTPHARLTDPSTSHEAGADSRGRMTQRSRILRAFHLYGPMTAREASAQADVNEGWKRVSDLRVLGFIAAVSEKVDPSTGKRVAVFQITPRGDAHLRGEA